MEVREKGNEKESDRERERENGIETNNLRCEGAVKRDRGWEGEDKLLRKTYKERERKLKVY